MLHADYNIDPDTQSGFVSIDEIQSSFKKIGFVLPNAYQEYIQLFGGGHVGCYPIYGLRKSLSMGIDKGSVLDITQQYKDDGWFSKERFNKENILVISSDFSGNPIILDEKGYVWLLDHDLGSTELLAENFEDFLINWCLKNSED
jgi:hypothetical protein